MAANSGKFQSLSHWGAFSAHVQDGRLVGVTPFSEDPHPNQLIDAWPEMIYAEGRVAAPSIRKGWLETVAKGLPHPGSGRGEDDFVTVPWDEALDLVASELKRVRDQHGAPSIFGGSYGWSSAGRFNHARTLIRRFLSNVGDFTDQVTNYSYGAAMRLLPHVLGDEQAVDGPVTDWPSIVEHCECFMAFGGLPWKNSQIQSGGSGLHPFDDYIDAAIEKGIEFVNISPMRSGADARIGAEWINIRPGSDVALMLALAYIVDSRGKADIDFLEKYCVGYEEFRSYIRGEVDSVPKTPEWAAKITDVPVETIVALADKIIGRRVMLTAAWSLQRAEGGEQPFWALIALASMLGQIGLPGAGVAFGYASMNCMGNPLYKMPITGVPIPKLQGNLKIPCARVSDLLLNPGMEFDFDGKRLTYPDIRLVYWAGGNPFHHHQDLFRLKSAFQRPETIIVHEPWWTATARHADIVLPATTTLERNDIGGSSRDPFIIAMHKAVQPVGDARDDYRIFSDVADRMGIGEAFHEGRSPMDWIRTIYQHFSETMSTRGFNPPSFDTFWEAGYVRIPEPTEKFTLFERFRNSPGSNPLKTPSGKIEIYSRTVAAFGYEECPGMPVWRAPSEWLGSDLADKYPLHMLSVQPPDKLHGQMDASAHSRSNKVGGRNPLQINPIDAGRRGLEDGAVARLFNDRGSTFVGIRFDDNIMPGVVCLPTGAAFDPLVDDNGMPLDNHGNPNTLTRDVGTSRLGQGSSAQTCLVEVEPYDDELQPIRAFSQPQFAERRPSPESVA